MKCIEFEEQSADGEFWDKSSLIAARLELVDLSTRLAVVAEQEGIDGGSLIAMCRYWTTDAINSSRIVVDRLHIRAILEIGTEGNPDIQARSIPKKRGRRKGSIKNDPRKDAKIYTDWKSSQTTIAAFCRNRGFDESESRLAINRHKRRISDIAN